MYFDKRAFPVLQEMGITEVNEEVRFLSRGPFYKES